MVCRAQIIFFWSVEEEILNILRNTKNNKTNILKKYGYLDNENYIKKLEDEKNVDRKINILYIWQRRLLQQKRIRWKIPLLAVS